MKDFLDEVIEAHPSPKAFRSKVDAALARRLFARKLVERRKALSLTQAQVAKRMNSTQAVVSKIEAGADVRASTLERYAAAVGRAMKYELVA